jgi:hypothetical protein
MIHKVPRRARPLLLAALLVTACQPTVRERLPPGDYTPREDSHVLPAPPGQEDALHREALRRAQVRLPPPRPPSEADLSRNPPEPDGFRETDVIDCRFVLKASEGFTPKFQCVRAGGDIVRVKYGRKNPEVFGEVAATRLLSALGYGADRMYVVDKVRCFGCPPFPYPKVGILDALLMDPNKVTVFETAVIERRLPGQDIRGASVRGWGFNELDVIDPSVGGAPREEVDAFRLLAAFLVNWDSKPTNQRLVCLPGGDPPRPDAPCLKPLAIMQDVGRAFGPREMDLERWAATPVWADPATCLLSMKGLPYDGATFNDVRIGEGGRRLLAGLLTSLSEDQIRGLFAGARFPEFLRQSAPGRDPDNWVRAFQGRVRQIADRPPCPTP